MRIINITCILFFIIYIGFMLYIDKVVLSDWNCGVLKTSYFRDAEKRFHYNVGIECSNLVKNEIIRGVLKMKIPAVCIDRTLRCTMVQDGAFQYRIPLCQPFQIVNGVQYPSSSTTNFAICEREKFHQGGVYFNMYIDVNIDLRDEKNVINILQIPEVIQYVAQISGDWQSNEPVPESEQNCQCGKEKHGFTSHCDWCPLYKEKEE